MEPTPTPPPTPTSPDAAAAPKKKAASPIYDGNTFCDIAGASDTVRFIVKKKFAGKTQTASKWVADLLAEAVEIGAVK
jgi:hypothetical protein